MDKKELIVSDTNIFLDLYDTNLMKEFFSLPYKIKTTMLVFSEIKDDKQLQAIKPFVDSNKLSFEKMTNEEFKNCFVLKLTRYVRKDNIKVHGMFFVFEEMMKNKIITLKKATEAVHALEKINKRFPRKIAEVKLNEWKIKYPSHPNQMLKQPDAESSFFPEH